jgi:Zn-dependent M28 family amino/carboxypeptidase
VYGAHNEELTNRSDHYPFYKNGSPAVLVIEPYDTAGDNFNPNYHSTNDTIDKVNLPYMTNVTKLVLAAGVEMAGLRDK